MKKLLISAILCSSFFTTANASEYSQWLKSQNQSFYTYKKSIDDEFSSMLKKQWKQYNAMYKDTVYKKPKPKILPKVKKTIKIPKKDLIKSVRVKPKKIIIKKQIPKNVVIKKIIKSGYKIVNINFYNQDIKISYDDKINFELYNINSNTISQAWNTLSHSEYKSLIKQIKAYSKKYTLNDWAKYQLIYKIGEDIYNSSNKANIFTWFIFTKMGYDTKVAYSNQNIYLLASVKQKLYSVSFINVNNKNYHILTPSGKINSLEPIFTYKSSYKKAYKKLSFDMNHYEIGLFTNIKKRNLNFDYNNKTYNISGNYSSDLIDFYKTFPQSEYNLYYGAKNSSAIHNSLLVQLKPLVANKTELQAVNLLLRFVQTSFKYKTDQEQFSYEKVFFPEETLYYSYSDCEDRSILFTYLVKNLLGLEVVALRYSDHMSAAVRFSTNINGDSFTYKNKKYTITDPTYINANVGKTMPKYKHKKFSVIR